MDARGDAGTTGIQTLLQELHLEDEDALREEFMRLQDERDSLEEQYQTLLSKVSQMRTTLGERLQQDAEELDRREQQIERLTGQVGELEITTSTLQQELDTAHEEAAKLRSETERLRRELERPPPEDHTTELNRLKERCNSLQEMLDAHQVETQRWETALIEERALKQELEARQQQLEQERARAEERERQSHAVADQEKQVARQLQQALEELQYGQESDHQRMVDEMQQKAEAAESELENYKLRIEQMESHMDEANQAKDRCGSLEQEVKEKNLLIGKLRHEAVILNEHLTGALNRLRRDSTDEHIDRRLMSNLILQFLGVPRADTRRYEILRLMASILQWNDAEREKAGLQRQSDRSSSYNFLGLGGLLSSQPRQPSQTEDKSSGDESVTNLFVEFLLSEVERAKRSPAATNEAGSADARPSGEASVEPGTFDLHSLTDLDRLATTMRFSLVTAVLCLFAAASAASVQKRDNDDVKAKIFLIRHGEKVNDDAIGLSLAGKQRAQCIANLFSRGDKKVDAIITQDFKSDGSRIRPYDTAKPLADRLGLTIDHHCDRDDDDCAADTVSDAAKKGAKTILVCWEHDALSDIADNLGIDDLDYPDDRFDIVFQMYDGEMNSIFSEECFGLDDKYKGWVGTRKDDLIDDDSWADGAGK
ncbi:hypothetical protein MCAP1_001834 [Malassezia caprae]|uniref:GRIP domain-containing protein n=1 Tax=Malassezia caprae TaxID=1381934 RepID=A0AAF0J024_9BASI|nr:hypothetical protein MCAP1_001834 [Malassezia caprae]